jgi:hypothetical protein
MESISALQTALFYLALAPKNRLPTATGNGQPES